MTAPLLDFTRGKTFGPLVVRWETNAILYKQISAISQTAPVRMTVTGTASQTDGAPRCRESRA